MRNHPRFRHGINIPASANDSAEVTKDVSPSSVAKLLKDVHTSLGFESDADDMQTANDKLESAAKEKALETGTKAEAAEKDAKSVEQATIARESKKNEVLEATKLKTKEMKKAETVKDLAKAKEAALENGETESERIANGTFGRLKAIPQNGKRLSAMSAMQKVRYKEVHEYFAQIRMPRMLSHSKGGTL